MGTNFKSVLKLNVFAPVLYAYGIFTGEEKYTDKAIELLHKTVAETNAKTRIFERVTLQQPHAFDTQAVIELYDHYCTHKRCLECGIGHKILRTNNHEVSLNNF